MKKIISLFAVITMLFSFSVTAFAATATMTVDPVEVAVADGTQDVVMNVVFNMNEATSLYGVQLEFKLPAGVTLKSVDWSELKAILPGSGDDVKDLTNGKASLFDDTASGTTAVSSLNIPCTLTVDTTEAKVYDISFTGSTGILDIDSGDYINADRPTTSITVKAAKTEETAPVNPANENAEFKLGDQTWTNVAIYEASFVLADIDTTKEYGIKEGNNKFSSTIAGEGTTTFVLAYYGVTTAPTVEKFWTGK